jgi:uncharacterized protein (TIGR02421 family)
MMQMLSKQQIITAIEQGEPINATLDDGSFSVQITEYVPYVCTAIHAGHNLRTNLAKKCLLSAEQRLIEEDPYTDQLINCFPITLVAHDSRYEYDLNRDAENCLYDIAWNKPVWKPKLTAKDRQVSLAKHQNYYDVLHALLTKLQQLFGGAFLLDLHSYNWQIRQYDNAPVFNIGTEQIDVSRWDSVIKRFESQLKKTKLAHVETTVVRNGVFYGRGYQATFINNYFNQVLIIPLEIKKVFMDETTGECYPLVLEKIQQNLYVAVINAVKAFSKKLQYKSTNKVTIQPTNIEPIVSRVDQKLYKIAKYIETLHYVNPINIQQEKKRFLTQRGYEPQFCYRQLKIDPYEIKEQLYRLPVSQIHDPQLRQLYRSVINTYATKIEMLAHIGKPDFLYNSLRYYGKPSQRDIDNALFLLHAKPFDIGQFSAEKYTAEQVRPRFEAAAKAMNLPCKVVVSSKLVAKAMVDNSRSTLLINKNAKFTEFDLNALIHHELGVHMVTTVNARQQPLKVFALGLPGNTFTQEGLAIYNEYRFGCINLKRLQQLSLRVFAVEMMATGHNFHYVFQRLTDDFCLGVDEAFGICTRVFRGGGFTKDYLYLSGFRDIVALAKQRSIDNLYIGKTGLKFIDTIDSLIDRGLLKKPENLPEFPALETIQNPVLDYLVSSIK